MTTRQSWRSGLRALLLGPTSGRFRLLRYFTVTSLVAFAVVALTLYFLQLGEERFFEAVQKEQGDFFAKAQADLVREQKEAALDDLLRVHEAGHVTLTHVFANALWQRHFASLVARARKIPMEHCRGVGPGEKAGDPAGPDPERQACFSALGKKIMALPGFSEANLAVHAMTSKTTVFKIKVYDLRGLTVYSSELGQIGEDKSDNRGWQSAIKGKPASELVHRERFSTFEGTVENRDLIQSYVPVLAPGGAGIAGVLEIYSDVTPFLQRINAVSTRISDLTAANQAKIQAAAVENQRKVETSSRDFQLIIGALLAVLYVALLMLVRNGQRIIDEQAHAREEAALREQRWHREKMAALATMAANVSHEVGNPLAIIAGLADDIARTQAAGEALGDQPRMIREQTARIAKMTRHITEFAEARRETIEPIDINQMAQAVCEFFSFDRRYRGTRIETRLGEQLPACLGIPDHVNEVLMNLLQAHEEACTNVSSPGGRILVQTEARGKEVMVRIGCERGPSAEAFTVASTDSRVEAARRRMEGMGGRLASEAATTDIFLPSIS